VSWPESGDEPIVVDAMAAASLVTARSTVGGWTNLNAADARGGSSPPAGEWRPMSVKARLCALVPAGSTRRPLNPPVLLVEERDSIDIDVRWSSRGSTSDDVPVRLDANPPWPYEAEAAGETTLAVSGDGAADVIRS